MKTFNIVIIALLTFLLTGCSKTIKNQAPENSEKNTQTNKNSVNTPNTINKFENGYFTFEYSNIQKVEEVTSANKFSSVRITGEKSEKFPLSPFNINISVENFANYINKLTFEQNIKTAIINSGNNSSALGLYKAQINTGSMSHCEQTKIKNNDALVCLTGNEKIFSAGKIFILNDQNLYLVSLSDGYGEGIKELGIEGYNNNLLSLLNDKPYYNIINSLNIK